MRNKFHSKREKVIGGGGRMISIFPTVRQSVLEEEERKQYNRYFNMLAKRKMRNKNLYVVNLSK